MPRRALAALLAWAALAGVSSAADKDKKDRPQVVTTLTIFAGTDAGAFRSHNWGLDWEKLQDPALAGLGAAHTIVPIGPRVYLGGEGGLYVSDDFGDTWKRILAGTTVLSVMPSRYSTADLTLFAGTTEGLVRSQDAGATFHVTSERGSPVNRMEWPGPALVVATGNTVVVSEDSATTFRAPGTGLPDAPVQALALSSFFAIDPVLYAAVRAHGLFRSADGGRTWSAAGLSGQSMTDLVWLGPFLYAAGEGGVQRTEDGGRTWTQLSEGLEGRNAVRLLFPLAPNAGSEAFLGTGDGVFHTPDGGQHWNGPTLKGRRVLCLATYPPPAPPLAKIKKR